VVYRDTGWISLRLGKGDGSGFSKEIGGFAYPGDLAAELPGNNGNSKSGTGWGSETEFLGMDMAAGDFDADGRDEAILVAAGYVFLLDNMEPTCPPPAYRCGTTALPKGRPTSGSL